MDVTDLVAATAELRATESRYSTLIEQIPLVTYLDDAKDGEGVYVSPQVEQVLGVSAEAWLESFAAWSESIHPDDREGGRRRLPADAGRDDERFDAEYRVVHPDGSVHWVTTRPGPSCETTRGRP